MTQKSCNGSATRACSAMRGELKAMQRLLFEEIRHEMKTRVQEVELQVEFLRQDVQRTRELLTKERDKRLNVMLPRRFDLRQVRALPLALAYVVPATAEDLRR